MGYDRFIRTIVDFAHDPLKRAAREEAAVDRRQKVIEGFGDDIS